MFFYNITFLNRYSIGHVKVDFFAYTLYRNEKYKIRGKFAYIEMRHIK